MGAPTLSSGPRPLHDAAKDGGLFGHEQRSERQAADEHDVLGAIAEEHFESEIDHGRVRVKDLRMDPSRVMQGIAAAGLPCLHFRIPKRGQVGSASRTGFARQRRGIGEPGLAMCAAGLRQEQIRRGSPGPANLNFESGFRVPDEMLFLHMRWL